MKKTSILLIWLISLFLYPVLSPAPAEAAPIIEKIRFLSSGDRVDQVTFELNGPHLPKTFALKGDRPRVVFDFPDAVTSKAVQNIMETKGNFITHIRTGIHRGDAAKTRVVFDLAPGHDIDFQQDFNDKTNTLVIRVFTAGTDLPAQTAPPSATAKTERETEEPITKHSSPSPDPKSADPSPAKKSGEKDRKIASIPPAEKSQPLPKSDEESTVIKPLSEIGEEEPARSALPPVLHSIEFDKNSNRGEIIIFKLNEFNPPVVFGIEEDIPRIVCFFKDTAAGEALKDQIDSEGRFVKAIKVGKYRNPDNIRVVLDLVPGRNYDLQQVFFKEDHLFMIIINTIGEKAEG